MSALPTMIEQILSYTFYLEKDFGSFCGIKNMFFIVQGSYSCEMCGYIFDLLINQVGKSSGNATLTMLSSTKFGHLLLDLKERRERMFLPIKMR